MNATEISAWMLIVGAVMSAALNFHLLIKNNYTLAENTELTEQIIHLERYKLFAPEYSQEFEEGITIDGVAFYNGSYLKVWTKGRTITQVLETCTHEYAHLNLDMGHNEDIRKAQEKIVQK